MATYIGVEQLGEIGRQAAALGQEARSAISAALLKGAKAIEPAAKAKAPRAAVHSRRRGISPKHLADVIVAVKGNARTAGLTVEGGANGPSYYWKYIEHGTTKMRAQPYMAPAAEEKENEAVEAVATELKRKLGL